MRIAFILLLIAFQQCQGKTQKSSINDKQAEVIYSYAKDSLPDYKFITVSSTICTQTNIETAFCCVSDFNGDGVTDYAILLRDAGNKVCLFSFSISNNSVKHYFIDCFGIWKGEITELQVAVEPCGTWEAIDEEIKVPFDGIIVDDLRESRSKAYYWNGDKFVKFLYD